MIPVNLIGASHWSWRDFPEGTDSLRTNAAQRLISNITVEGAVRAPCSSRVLESSLALPLLQKAGLSGRADAVRRYLAECCDNARVALGPLEVAMARGALGDAVGYHDVSFAESYLPVLPAFLTQRKRMQFEVLGLLTGQRTKIAWQEEALSLEGLHSWARVQVTAVKVIAAFASGQSERIDDEDVRILLETQRGRGVWEDNVFIHLLVLHALALLPRTEAVLRIGVAALSAYQRPDGGFPFVASTDTWSSVTAGVALWSAGAPASVLERLAAHIASRQSPAGGWSFNDQSNQTDTDCTSVAVQFLHCVDPVSHDASIKHGLRSIVSVAGVDGGFPTYVARAASEACMTAGCLDALCVRPDAHADRTAPGLALLARQQRADGSFPLSWSVSLLHTIFRVLLVSLRETARTDANACRLRDRCLSYVTREQNKDGGWGQRPGEASDAISTAYALICLCCADNPRPAAEAVEFLLGSQRPDGSICSIPDTLGPRPFPFAVPILADIFTLLALGHLRHRIGDVPR